MTPMTASLGDTMEEGVIRFSARHETERLSQLRYPQEVGQLIAWREILVRLGVVGRTEGRYGGAGYGNLSARVGPRSAALGRRSFLITGTQTGGHVCMSSDALCLVESYSIQHNTVVSRGVSGPSSESLTHGAVYDLGPHIRNVIHAHCAEIWASARVLQLPMTRPAIAYGSTEMAEEMRRVAGSTTFMTKQILVMQGHEDGVIAFGRTLEEAARVLLDTLAEAYRLLVQEDGVLCRRR